MAQTQTAAAKIAARIADLLAQYAAPAVEAPAVAPAVGSTVEVPKELAVAVLATRAAEAAAKAEKEKAEKALKGFMGDAYEATVGGLVVFTYAPQERQTLDTTALREAMPEVAAAFTKATVVRSLLAKSKIAAQILA